MRKLLLKLCFLGTTVGFATATHAATLPAATDTLPGHKRLVQQLAASVCHKLETEHKQSAPKNISAKETEELFKNLMVGAMTDNADAFAAIFSQYKTSEERDKAAEVLCTDMIMHLLGTCPVSQGIVMQLGVAAMPNQPGLTKDEQEVLGKITVALCERLDRQNASTPFASYSPEKRQKLFEETMMAVCLQHLVELQQLYGEEAMNDADQGEVLGQKIAVLMVKQCPNYLFQMGIDYNNQHAKAAAPAPAAASKATPKQKSKR